MPSLEPVGPLVRIRAVRTGLGLTLADACSRIAEQGVRISVGGLANVETGARPASNQLLVAWAKAFGISPLDVCKGALREIAVEDEPEAAAS